jgi:hypothetical protein
LSNIQILFRISFSLALRFCFITGEMATITCIIIIQILRNPSQSKNTDEIKKHIIHNNATRIANILHINRTRIVGSQFNNSKGQSSVCCGFAIILKLAGLHLREEDERIVKALHFLLIGKIDLDILVTLDHFGI